MKLVIVFLGCGIVTCVVGSVIFGMIASKLWLKAAPGNDAPAAGAFFSSLLAVGLIICAGYLGNQMVEMVKENEKSKE